MMVLEYISLLLIEHDCVVVPGLGGFITNYAPARIHPVLHTFAPPSKDILFNPNLKNNDGLLAHTIALRENISYDAAMDKIAAFARECKQHLENKQKVEVSRVGTLYSDVSGKIRFEQNSRENYLTDSFGLTDFVSPAIIREAEVEPKITGLRPVKAQAESKPSLLKRIAIVSIPAAAMLIWGFFSSGTVRELSTNYSSLLSVFGNVSGKIIPYKVPEGRPGMLVLRNSPYVPGDKLVFTSYPGNGLPYPELITVHSGTTEEATPAPSHESDNAIQGFYVIGGCFKNIELAENFLAEIMSAGHTEAGMFGPSGKGYYKVYYSRHNTKELAREALSEIKTHSDAKPWLLEYR